MKIEIEITKEMLVAMMRYANAKGAWDFQYAVRREVSQKIGPNHCEATLAEIGKAVIAQDLATESTLGIVGMKKMKEEEDGRQTKADQSL